MGALTQPRLTPHQLDAFYPQTGSVGMASGATVFVGGLMVGKTVGTGSALRGVPGQIGTGLRVLGVVGNQKNLIPGPSYTSVSDGSPSLEFDRGAFKFDIDSTDPVTLADLYNLVYITDDHTICRSWVGGKSAAGILVGIDDFTDPNGAGAWVEIAQLPTSAPNPTGIFLP